VTGFTELCRTKKSLPITVLIVVIVVAEQRKIPHRYQIHWKAVAACIVQHQSQCPYLQRSNCLTKMFDGKYL
jgi:hypothetical protein